MMKTENLKLTDEWDKTFPKSNRVEHSKVTDLYDRVDIIPFDRMAAFFGENLK